MAKMSAAAFIVVIMFIVGLSNSAILQMRKQSMQYDLAQNETLSINNQTDLISTAVTDGPANTAEPDDDIDIFDPEEDITTEVMNVRGVVINEEESDVLEISNATLPIEPDVSTVKSAVVGTESVLTIEPAKNDHNETDMPDDKPEEPLEPVGPVEPDEGSSPSPVFTKASVAEPDDDVTTMTSVDYAETSSGPVKVPSVEPDDESSPADTKSPITEPENELTTVGQVEVSTVSGPVLEKSYVSPSSQILTTDKSKKKSSESKSDEKGEKSDSHEKHHGKGHGHGKKHGKETKHGHGHGQGHKKHKKNRRPNW